MERIQFFKYKTIKKMTIVASLILLTFYAYFYFNNFLLFHLSIEFTIILIAVFSSLLSIFRKAGTPPNFLIRVAPTLIVYSVMLYFHNLSFDGLNFFTQFDPMLHFRLNIFANLSLAIGVAAAVTDTKSRINPIWRFIISIIVFTIMVLLSFFILTPEIAGDFSYINFKFISAAIIIAIYIYSIITTLTVSDHLVELKLSKVIILLALLVSEVLFMINTIGSDSILIMISLEVRLIGFAILLYLAIRINLIDTYNDLIMNLLLEKESQVVLKNEVLTGYYRLAKSQEIGHVGSWEYDLQTGLVWASDEAFKIYGFEKPDDNIIDMEIAQSYVVKEDRKMMDQAMKDLVENHVPYNVYFSIVNANGEYHYINSTATIELDESQKPKTVNGVIHDITDMKEQQDRLVHESTHDHLTGVLNRRSFSSKRSKFDQLRYLPVSTIIIDINGLKVINDSFGHHVGNEVLKKLAEILNENITNKKDFVARIGGDEFAIILPNKTKTEAEEYMKLLLEKINAGKVKNINISVAYGIASRTSLDEHFDETLKRAEDEMYLYKIADSASASNKIIDALLTTLYEKDYYSQEHSQRVSDYAFLLAKASNLSDKVVQDIKIAGLLHDIGKITISNEVLNKKGKLTKAEYDIIKTHSEKGYRIIHTIGGMDIIANYVLQHHEHYNGNGYPNGLAGDDISIEARIIAIADSYDAMTSFREYKKSMNMAEAIKEIQACKGTQFDPKLADIFINEVLKNDNKKE